MTAEGQLWGLLPTLRSVGRTLAARDPVPLLRWLALAGAAGLCGVYGPRWGAPDATAMVALMLAAAASSIAGFAFSAICGAMLFHLIADPIEVVKIMIVCSIANQAAMTWTLRRDVVWRQLWVYLLGGALGVPAGVWLLLHADRAAYTGGLGIGLVAYGAYMLLRRPLVLPLHHRGLDFGVAVLSGIAGGAAGFPSAAVTIWCSFRGWNKHRQRAICQPFILLMQIVALLVISFTQRSAVGMAAIPTGELLCIPASLLGTAIGMACYRNISDLQFARAVNLLLIVSGLSYLI
jgi:uncharacterized membrane protein YfcA